MSDHSRTARPGRRASASEGNIFARFSTFLAQIVAELRKVVRPTREQLISYTSIVIVFVVLMMTYVFALDQAFLKLIEWTFGN